MRGFLRLDLLILIVVLWYVMQLFIVVIVIFELEPYIGFKGLHISISDETLVYVFSHAGLKTLEGYAVCDVSNFIKIDWSGSKIIFLIVPVDTHIRIDAQKLFGAGLWMVCKSRREEIITLGAKAFKISEPGVYVAALKGLDGVVKEESSLLVVAVKPYMF